MIILNILNSRSIEKYRTAQQTPGVLVVRLDAPLFFANCPHFESAVEKMVEEENDRAADAGGEDGVRRKCREGLN